MNSEIKDWINESGITGEQQHSRYRACLSIDNVLEGKTDILDIQNLNLSDIPEIALDIRVKYIYAQGNSFFGNIPDKIFDLTDLLHLNLSNNSLSGEIPINILNFQKLEYLDLSLNNFSGEIPTYVWDLPLLSDLNLSYNDFSGDLPDFIKKVMFNLDYDYRFSQNRINDITDQKP